MKRLFFLIILTYLISPDYLQAHKEWVHQYLAKESYGFLEYKIGVIYPDLRDHIGLNFDGRGSDNEPWLYPYVAAGAWREDLEDPVYGYGGWFNGWTPTVTHFWRADDGLDDVTPITASGNAENAYTKAMVYLFGGHRIFYKKKSYNSTIGEIILGLFYSYDDLVDLYSTGHCYNEGYIDLSGNAHYYSPIEIYMDLQAARNMSYIILGRVAHLLADMSVPAHTHADMHPCEYDDGDSYELWMGNNHTGGCNDEHTSFPAQAWNRDTAYNQGSLLDISTFNDQDAITYLFYTQNQITNHFSTHDFGGNNNTPAYGSVWDDYVLERFGILGPAPSSSVVDHNAIANETFNLAIRTTATLYNWFAIKTGQLSYPPPHITNFTQRPNPMIVGRSGNIYCNATGPDLSYNWEVLKNNCNATFNYHGHYVTVTIPSSKTGDNLKGPLREIELKCTVSNISGSRSGTHDVNIAGPGSGGGCPFVFVENEMGLQIDNNILHRSVFVENIGKDIVDLYKLNTQPESIKNQYTLQIRELNDDHSYFDNCELYAVDHPANTEIGVDEDNNIVKYDKKEFLKPSKILLDGVEIKDNSISGNGGETIDIYFPENSFKQYNDWSKGNSPIKYALFFNAGALTANTEGEKGIPKNQKTGMIVGNSTSTIDIARRENNSAIIVPIDNDISITHISLKWKRDFTISDIALAPIDYKGFKTNNLQLTKALHKSFGDVRDNLLKTDEYYAELESSDILTLSFDTAGEVKPGWTRSFVFETVGHYDVPQTGEPSNFSFINENNLELVNPTEFALSEAYPNPFNPVTTIAFEIPEQSSVSLKVFDIQGKVVAELFNGRKDVGRYTVQFDGSSLSSGVYFYEIISNPTSGKGKIFQDIKKMMLVK